MRWYINDISLQGQFEDPSQFMQILDELMALRFRFEALRTRMYVAEKFSTALIQHGVSVRQLLQQPSYQAKRGLILRWLANSGPFIENERTPEGDDYFDCEGLDVTHGGLGECARRTKIGETVSSYSFSGGMRDFSKSPLTIYHGLPEDRLGAYQVCNLWTPRDLEQTLVNSLPPPGNWRELIETARLCFPKLWLPDALHLCQALAREPFDSIISDRTLALLKQLNRYMEGRRPDGSETDISRNIIEEHFTGDRAAFSGESATNRERFKRELTFPDPSAADCAIFAHWHGKISHRYFRLHFEWPVPPGAEKLKVLYLGPKLTKG